MCWPENPEFAVIILEVRRYSRETEDCFLYGVNILKILSFSAGIQHAKPFSRGCQHSVDEVSVREAVMLLLL